MTKYIFVTGGVVSGLGKGITAASLGRLLKNRGLKVAAQKLDPYINVDPGTMSPYQHGEVYLGICLGMQIAVIEFARSVAGIADADSGEFDELCAHKVIDFMPGQSSDIDKGGTLRLGAYPCVVQPNTTMARCYKAGLISERHRHRYELNNDYRNVLTANGLTLSGLSPDGKLVETVELTDRAFFVGVQYHLEFKSRPNKPHPLFYGFIEAALNRAEGKKE